MEEEDYDGCSNEEVAEAVAQLHALISASESQLFVLLRVLAAREAFAEDGCRDLIAWLVARIGVSARTARRYVETAGALSCLPALSRLLEAGRVCLDQLAPVARVATRETDAALAAELVGLSAAQAEALGRRAAEVDPKEEAAAHRRRHLSIRQQGQCTHLSGAIDGLDGESVRAALERIASGYGPDPETGNFDPHDRRLADALVELCNQRLAGDGDPERANVTIYVEREVLEGSAAGGGETSEWQPLSAEAVRRAACDARYRPLYRDLRTGKLDLGRTTRSIPPSLGRYLRHRDGGCRFPGCRGRRGVEGHHVQYWAAGGPTSKHNLVSLCRRCHRLVHEGGWRIEGDAEGKLVFVAPNGRRISTRPVLLRDDVRRRFLVEQVSAGTGAGARAPAGPDPPAGA